MSVRNLLQSFDDRERVPKIQGLLNECMTFLDDELSVITGPYEDLLSIDDVIDQELILFVTLNINKNTEPVRALGKMLLQNLQLVVGKRYESEEERKRMNRPHSERRAGRVRAVRVPELRPDPADGARHQHRVPVLDAEPAATPSGRQGLQGRRHQRAEHEDRDADAGRGDVQVLHPGVGRAHGDEADGVAGARADVRLGAI